MGGVKSAREKDQKSGWKGKKGGLGRKNEEERKKA